MGMEQEPRIPLENFEGAVQKPKRRVGKVAALAGSAVLTVLALSGCGGGEAEEPSQTPVATETTTPETPTVTPETPTVTPETLNLEFPDIPAAPEGVSGKDSLADLMEYVLNHGSPIVGKDFILKSAGGPADEPRTFFEVQLQKKDVWMPGDEEKFRQMQKAVLEWIAPWRNLSEEDCKFLIFTIPPGDPMKFTDIDRTVDCLESAEK